MNQQELIAKISADSGVTKTQAGDVLTVLGFIAQETLKSGGEVTLPGLGKLKAASKAARTGRNPATGAEIEIPAKTVAKFVPAKALKDALA